MAENSKFEFGVETKKMLKLMIHSLYTNKDIVVRELISNSSDACDKLRYLSNTDQNVLNEGETLKIRIDIDENAKTLSIIDNGIGMSREELITQLGTIAKSGTENFMKELEDKKGSSNDAMQLIGQFGVGFYSAFMIANKVQVISQKVGSNEANIWESEGDGEFTVKKYDGEFNRGTIVKLFLKDDETDFVDKFHIKNIVKAYSDHITFPIELKLGTEYETVNSGVALWTKPKNEIKPEEYQSFFKHLTFMPGKPFMILHNKVEGAVTFTNLLFIPEKKGFDLYSPDRITRVKLYVKKVFITEENVDLLPKYLRFVYGIVDSEDLPLNINRESLQYNSMISKINKALTKKIISELAKKDENEPEEYLKFWNEFGQVLKEGLCESNVNADELLNICKFYTSKSPNVPISLNTYIDRMKEGQKDIYYITGDSVNNLDNSPQVEGFKDKDIEVVYLTDNVDSFWTTATTNYKEKRFKSISKANVDLDNLNPKEKQEESEEKFDDDKEKQAEEEKLKNITEEQNKDVLDFFKKVLEKNNIKDVKVSKKLTTSPVCLVADEKSMDIKLERFLIEQKQLIARLPKILEINVNHPIILKIKENLNNKEKEEELNDVVKNLYDEACILEGEIIDNPSEFVKRINKLMYTK